MNPYEIYLPNGIRYGTIISVYYLVGGNAAFKPVIHDTFGVGDISKLSFLEFIELIQKKMINARNRKTITDFKGGWYPALLKIYVEYLKRANLPNGDPLKSNGYTFHNLYSFLSKYNSFFQRFVDQLLPATIILRRSGLLVRNSVFSKQKFMYRRGVNIYSGSSTTIDKRGNPIVQYYGSDGALFTIAQTIPPPPPPPPILYVETSIGSPVNGSVTGKFYTGGIHIQGYNVLTEYGIQYRKLNGVWINLPLYGSLLIDNFSESIGGLMFDTIYEYRAYIKSGIYGYTANTLQITIPIPTPIIIPSIHTCQGSANVYSIDNTGGKNIVRYGDVQYYGMQYREIGQSTSDITISPTTLSVSSAINICDITVIGDAWNTYTITKDPALTWIVTDAPIPPSLIGTINQITVASNSCAVRSGIVCYTPIIGTTKQVSVSQASGLPALNYVSMSCVAGGDKQPLYELACSNISSAIPVGVGECYSIMLNWGGTNPAAGFPLTHRMNVYCNGNNIYSCVYSSKLAKTCGGTWGPILVKHGDSIGVDVYSDAQTILGLPSTTSMGISNVTNGIGNFAIGTTPTYMLSITAQTDSSVL